MKVKIVQNRNTYGVYVKRGMYWDWVYTNTPMTKDQAFSRYYTEKLLNNDTEDATIIQMSKNIRIAYYNDDLSSVQIRTGILFKKWRTYHETNYDNRPSDKGNCPAGYWTGKIFPLKISMKIAERLGLQINDKELSQIIA